jgi:PEP-CTERM/exosortase A-associated glycosyltransferase
MNILHVLSQSTPNISGYSSRSNYVMQFQARLGFRPIAITFPRHGSSTADVEQIDGLTYYRSRIPHSVVTDTMDKIPFLRERQSMRYLEASIDAVASKHSIDLIHAHSPILCGIPAAKVARRLHIPFVYEVRALWEDAAVDLDKVREGSLNYRIIRHLETALLRKSDVVVAICQGLKTEIELRGIDPDRVCVVPNGVDTDIFAPVERDTTLAQRLGVSDSIVVGFVGQFFTFEGLVVLLKAMARLVQRRSDCKLVIVGSGTEATALQALSRDLKLESRVVFTGKVPHAEVVKYYSIMDILVYPRLRRRITEMVTPIKTLEAMAMEKAVIASDVGGLKELIDHNATGLLFRAEDDNDLAETLHRCIEDAELRRRLGRDARMAMMRSRNWEKLIAPYTSIYAKAVENKR